MKIGFDDRFAVLGRMATDLSNMKFAQIFVLHLSARRMEDIVLVRRGERQRTAGYHFGRIKIFHRRSARRGATDMFVFCILGAHPRGIHTCCTLHRDDQRRSHEQICSGSVGPREFQFLRAAAASCLHRGTRRSTVEGLM